MDIAIKDKGFFIRLLFGSGAIYGLLIFTLIETVVFWGKEFDWIPFFKINLIIFPIIILAFIRAFIFSKRFIYRLIINENNIEIFYTDLNRKKDLVMRMDNLYVSVKGNKYDLSKVATHRIEFKQTDSKDLKGFDLKFRQFEIGDWKIELMKKIDSEIMKIQYNCTVNEIIKCTIA